MTAEQIKGILSDYFAPPEWACYAELKESISDYSRRIDFFAISCHKKNGWGHSLAFEIKISREDFGVELKDPDKRKPFFDQCNEFYFVTPPDLVKIDEVPFSCGLIEITPDVIYKKYAQQKDSVIYKPEFVASLVRRSDNRNPQTWKLFSLQENFSERDLEKIIMEEAHNKMELAVQKLRQDIRDDLIQTSQDKYEELLHLLSKYIPVDLMSPTLLEDLEKQLISMDLSKIRLTLRQLISDIGGI